MSIGVLLESEALKVKRRLLGQQSQLSVNVSTYRALKRYCLARLTGSGFVIDRM
ncbi:MAG: hypothetical protein P8X89_09465 [Reinekea sp.]